MHPGRVEIPPSLAGPLHLEPFRALMLSPQRIGDPASARVFARPYRSVARRIDDWARRHRLTHDDQPALYLHEYVASGMAVRGLVGLLDITRLATDHHDRAVFPHEGIHPQQVDELADRMAAMRLNPAPILLVHRGPQTIRDVLAEVRSRTPDQDYEDRSGQRHRVWAIRDAGTVTALQSALAPCRLLIADGHHRYAAYVSLHRRSPVAGSDTGLAMVIDHDETPLFLGAIHRVLDGTGLDDLAQATVRAGGELQTGLDEQTAINALGPHVLVATDGVRWNTLDLSRLPGEAAVEILHTVLVPALEQPPTRIHYPHAVPDALRAAAPGRATCVLMPAPDLDLIGRVVMSGRLLPEKATSFQPKPSLGSFFRLLDD